MARREAQGGGDARWNYDATWLEYGEIERDRFCFLPVSVFREVLTRSKGRKRPAMRRRDAKITQITACSFTGFCA
jgi:uncharacterized protein VirK/YbjX